MSLKTPEKIRTFQRKLYVVAKQKPTQRFHALYDKVYRSDVLSHGYALCRANGGAPGVDGMTFEMIESRGLDDWLERLQEELRTKTYEPQAVRRVMIPKPGGGERPLGIPTIRDRVVQMAVKLVIEPIFEADFDEGAFGYRPKRSAQQAIKTVHRELVKGRTDVVDADLSKYFDTIPHDALLKSVARRIVDRALLALIKAWLKVPVQETDNQGRTRISGGKSATHGTPQGGVISPLLANIYMHRYLRAWRERGKAQEYDATIVNYADDFVILSRNKAREALEWTKQVMKRIGLELNETKTKLCDARHGSFNFLGYTFGPEHFRKDGRWYLGAKPSKKAIQRLKDKVGEVLTQGVIDPWQEVCARLNRVLAGWSQYFSYGTLMMAYRAIENHVMRKVQQFLTRRHKVPGQGTRRFSDAVIFGRLGVIRMRWKHLGRPACATT